MEKSIEVPYHCVPSREYRFFSCQLCSNTYLSWGNLVAHRKACHRGRVLSCDACGQRKFHPSLGPLNYPVGGSAIGCEECGEGFSTITQLYRHYRVHGTHQFMADEDKLTQVLCVCPSLCNNSDITIWLLTRLNGREFDFEPQHFSNVVTIKIILPLLPTLKPFNNNKIHCN
jgi:hypothetical protein